MIATIIITLIIAAIVALIVANQIRKKRNGQSGCGCGCSNCSMSDICHKE